MKKSFYQRKKEAIKSSTLIFTVIIAMSMFFYTSCGPSANEIEAQRQAESQSDMRHATISIDNCGCNSFTATYYSADSCEYIGLLDNSSSSFMTHSGQCKRCEKRQVHLMDSIVKANLKEFFAIKQ
jgi:hypothetical protein